MEQTYQGLVERPLRLWSGQQRDHQSHESRHNHFCEQGSKPLKRAAPFGTNSWTNTYSRMEFRKTPENMWRVKFHSRWCAGWVRNATHVHLSGTSTDVSRSKSREPGRSSWTSCVAKDGSPSCIRHLEAPTSIQFEPSGEARVAEPVQTTRSSTARLSKPSHRVERMYWRDCRSYQMDITYWE